MGHRFKSDTGHQYGVNRSMVGRKFVVLLIKVRFLVCPLIIKREGSLAELVECDGLENHWASNRSVGSNPTASAKKMKEIFGKQRDVVL